MASKTYAGSIVAGLASALGATACCVGPLVLATLGLGGAWAAGMRQMAGWMPLFIAGAVLCFAFAAYQLWVREAACQPGEACALPEVQTRRKRLFGVFVLLAVGLVTLPWWLPLVA